MKMHTYSYVYDQSFFRADGKEIRTPPGQFLWKAIAKIQLYSVCVCVCMCVCVCVCVCVRVCVCVCVCVPIYNF